MSKYALVTGSSGLIGSEAVTHLCEKGFNVIGVDNNLRAFFFGEAASTEWNSKKISERFKENFRLMQTDIRNYQDMEAIFRGSKFEIIIHAAAQPSHDWAAKDPIMDFTVNANGTLNLLELTRKYCPEATFIFTSTNKVYGDTPNQLPLLELENRWEIEPSHEFYMGINETMSLDQTTHSLFGVSKTSADLLVQEYGRYFGLKTAVFRGGCLTGPMHSPAELHGFLAYLVRCIVSGKKYTIFGYKGKQVRDNIHSSDLISMFMAFHANPIPGAVFNAGGGRSNSISILEAINEISKLAGKEPLIEMSQENRVGDHIWYITDTSKFERHYPNWVQQHSLSDILTEMVLAANS